MQHISKLLKSNRFKGCKLNLTHQTKKLAQSLSIIVLCVPVESIGNPTNQPLETVAYDTVIASGTLTVASVKGSSTFFSTDGFQHGFGYDLARAYAQDLGVKIKILEYDTDNAALKAVLYNQAHIALTTASTQQTETLGLAAINVSCGFDEPLTLNGLHLKTNWSFNKNDDALAINASNFLCANKQRANTANLANFYDQSLLQDDYNRHHFKKTLDKNLPIYKASFQQNATNHNLDWQLLVAMGYQESQLDANAVSPTGVKGLMMLTNNTAKAMGVSNRIDPHQSIRGGARYLDEMQDLFINVPNPDRLWFSLASYNMGPNAVKKIQRQLEAEGKNPDRWANVYAYLSDNAEDNSRYGQCMHYVSSIRSYLESLKTQTT